MPRKKLKIIDVPDKVSKALKETATKVGKPKMPKHVLKINNWLYVTCDKAIAYASTLDWMLKIMVQRMIRIPSDFIELGNKLQEIYDLIDARIPADTRPRDVFEDCKYKQDK